MPQIEKGRDASETSTTRSSLKIVTDLERIGDLASNIAKRALELNPFHFGAQSGLAQCFVRLKKPRTALRAFRQALKINPDLDGVAESIRELEESLGEGK